MSREAFDFLTESPLWLPEEQREEFASLKDDELKSMLTQYRAHVLAMPIEVASGLSIAVSARDDTETSASDIKRSILYCDEVLLPDPVFTLTEWTRDRVQLPWIPNEAPRSALVRAVRYMRALTPMVRLGRVRFVPTTRVLEAPEELAIVYSQDSFISTVPENLRAWFREHATIRKIITDDQGGRVVLEASPDADTSSIQVDFGQLGPVAFYEYMRILEINEDRTFRAAQGPPEDNAAMQQWLVQSVNRAAGGLFGEILADAGIAWKLGCSFMTSCQVTAEILDALAAPQMRADGASAAALRMELPVLESVSIDQLAELIERENDAFEAFRFELRTTAEGLARIDDPVARAEEARKAGDKLAREQVYAVQRKMREAKRTLKWDIPLTVAQLAVGALGLLAGNPTFAAFTAGLVTGGINAANTVKKQVEYRNLPGYFLWRLGESMKS